MQGRELVLSLIELTFYTVTDFTSTICACTGMKRGLNTRSTIDEYIDDGFIRRILSLLSDYNNDLITSDLNNHTHRTSKHSKSYNNTRNLEEERCTSK